MSKIQERRNEVTRLIRPMNRHLNMLKFNPSENYFHALKKLEICYWLRDNGMDFYTEAIFIDSGLRADIINLNLGIIYEILNSEKEKSIEKKKERYPLPITFIKAESEFNEKELM